LANEIEVAIGARKPSQKPWPEDDMSKEVELMMDKYFLATKKIELAAVKNRENEGALKRPTSMSL